MRGGRTSCCTTATAYHCGIGAGGDTCPLVTPGLLITSIVNAQCVLDHMVGRWCGWQPGVVVEASQRLYQTLECCQKGAVNGNSLVTQAALLHGIEIGLAHIHVAVGIGHAVSKVLGLQGAGLLLPDNLLGSTNSLGGLGAFAAAKHRIHGTVSQCGARAQGHACCL